LAHAPIDAPKKLNLFTPEGPARKSIIQLAPQAGIPAPAIHKISVLVVLTARQSCVTGNCALALGN
jgi:hypothetical protein